MHSSSWFSPARRLVLTSAAILIAGSFSFAQTSKVSQVQLVASDTYSSSSDAMPSAPEPKPAAGGQYDNRSARGGHGWRDHVTYEIGGGFNTPTDYSSNYVKFGGNVTAGAGIRMNKAVSLLAEWQFIRDGLPNAIVAQTGASGGNVHIWSLTLDPVINLMPKSSNSVYVTGGGGFYRKVTNFTDPQPVQYCTYYYCGVTYQTSVVGHFSSNQGGWSAGAGYAHRFGGMYGDGNTQLFAEARYLKIMTPAVNSSPNGLGNATIGADTVLIPVTVGLRF